MVISVIAILTMILLPALARAKGLAKGAQCLAAVHAQLSAIHMYASCGDGTIPTGSDHPQRYSGQSPMQPICTLATFQMWLGLNQEYTGLGVLRKGDYLAWEAMFCPLDDGANMAAESNMALSCGARDGWCSYLYRQVGSQAPPLSARIDKMGVNPAGNAIRVLVLDAQCTLNWPGLPIKRNHLGAECTLGLLDGGAKSFTNNDERFTMNGSTSDVFARLDAILETADSLCP